MADDVAAAATATAPLPNGAGVGVGDGVEVGPGVDESSTTTSEAVPLFSPTSTMVLEGAFDDIEDMLLDGGGEEPPQQHGDTAGGSEVEEGGSAARDGGSVGLTLPPHPGAPSSATTVGRVERSASEAAASVASNTSGETTTAARTAASASRARSLSATNLTPGTYAPTNAVHMVLQENAKVPTFNLTVDRSNAAAGRSRSGSLGIKHGVFFAPSSAAATAAGAKSEADGKGQGAGREMHNNAHQQHPSQSQQQQQQHMHGGGMAPSTSRDIDEMLRLSENDANLTEMFLGSKQRSSASLAYSCAGAMLSSIGSRIGEKTTPPPPPGAGGDIATADGAGDDSKALKESSVMAASFSSPENNVGNGGQKPPTPLLLSPTIQPLNGAGPSVEMKGNVPVADPLQSSMTAPHSGSKRPLHPQGLTGMTAPAASARHSGGAAAKGVPSIPATTAQIAPGPSQLTQHIYSYYPYGRPHPLPIPTVVSAPNAAAAPKPGASSGIKIGAPNTNARSDTGPSTYAATGKGSSCGALPASKAAKKQDSTIAAALNTAAVLATTKQQEALVADVPMSLPPLTAKSTSTKIKTTAPPPAVDTSTAAEGKGAESLAGKGPGGPKSVAEDVNVTPDATASRDENDTTDDTKSTSSSTTPKISNQSPKVVPTPAPPGQPTPTPSVSTGLVPSPLAPASASSKPQPKEPLAPNATTRSQYPVHPGHPNGAPAPLYPLHPSYYHPHPTFHYPAPAAPHAAAHVTPSASILEAAKRRSQFGFGGNHAVASVPMPLSNVKFPGGSNAAAAAAATTKNGAAARKKPPAPPPTGIPAPINPFAAPIVGSAPPVDPCVAYERKKQRAKDARINMNESIERLSVAINLAGSQSKQRAAHLLPSDDTSSQSRAGAKLAESELALVKSMNDCSAAADCAKKWDRPSFVGTAATLIQNLNNQCEALMREVVELKKGQEDRLRGTRADSAVKAGRSLSNGSSHPNEVLVSSDCCSNDTEDLDEKRAQHAGQPCSSAMSIVRSTAAPSPKRQKVESLAPSDSRRGATSQRGETSSVIFEKKTSIEEQKSRDDSSHSELLSAFFSDGSMLRSLASFLDPLSMVRCRSVSKKWHGIASFVCDEVWLGLCNKRFGVVTVRKWKSKEEDDNDEDFLIADSDQQPAKPKHVYFSLYKTMKAASVKPHCHIEGNVMLGRANIGGLVGGWVSFVERSNGETLRSVRRERTSAGKLTSYYTSLPVVELRILIQNTGSYDGCVAIPDQVISVDASTRRRSEQMDEITTDERFQKTIMRLDGSTICEGGLEPQKCSQAAALHELRLFEAAVLVAHIHARGCSTTAKFQQRAKFAKVLLSVNKTTVPLVLPFRNQDEPAG